MGRPTKYKEEYCDMLIEHMKQGYSFESFASRVGVHVDSLYEWCKMFPEFSESKKKGFASSQTFWEDAAIKGLWNITEHGQTLNTSLWIFNMKNRFKWTDRHEVTKDVKDMDDDEFNVLAAKVVERIKNESPGKD